LGKLAFDPGKLDGTPKKLLDTSRLTAVGSHPTVSLDAGIADTYAWYSANTWSLRRSGSEVDLDLIYSVLIEP